MHGTVSTNHQHKVSRLLGKHNIRKIQDRVESKFLRYIYIGYCVSASNYVLYRTLCEEYLGEVPRIQETHTFVSTWEFGSGRARHPDGSLNRFQWHLNVKQNVRIRRLPCRGSNWGEHCKLLKLLLRDRLFNQYINSGKIENRRC